MWCFSGAVSINYRKIKKVTKQFSAKTNRAVKKALIIVWLKLQKIAMEIFNNKSHSTTCHSQELHKNSRHYRTYIVYTLIDTLYIDSQNSGHKCNASRIYGGLRQFGEVHCNHIKMLNGDGGICPPEPKLWLAAYAYCLCMCLSYGNAFVFHAYVVSICVT